MSHRLTPRARREGVEESNAWQPEGGLVPVEEVGGVAAVFHWPGVFGTFQP